MVTVAAGGLRESKIADWSSGSGSGLGLAFQFPYLLAGSCRFGVGNATLPPCVRVNVTWTCQCRQALAKIGIASPILHGVRREVWIKLKNS